MYLSKILLDVRSPSVRQALRDANDMHRNLMSGFAMSNERETPRADFQVLYRIIERRDGIELLVSSAERPNAEALASHGFCTNESLIRDMSALKAAFAPGRILRFELLASPSRKVVGEGKNSRRFFLEREEERLAWLCRKGKQGGFEILQANEIGGRRDVLGRRGGMEIKNAAVLFSGVLKITDKDAFWRSYTQGIGPGKAYGLGMLSVSAR